MATLYVIEQGATVSKADGRIVVRKRRKILEEIPAIKVAQIVIFGNAQFTTPAVRFVLENNIDVAYLSSQGKYRGRLQLEPCKNASLRQNQYKRSLAPQFCLCISRNIVAGKIQNLLSFCQRQRDKGSGLRGSLNTLRKSLRQVRTADTLDKVRGYEGAASAAYFRAFGHFLKVDLGFNGRNRHPPSDPVNALLSLGYTLLYNNVQSAINIVGLDPYQGFFHQTKHGHAALASDLVEEWRAVIVDSIVLHLINGGALRKKDFRKTRDGIRLKPDGLEKFLKRYDGRLATEVLYSPLGCRLSYRQCFELQVRHLADVILGKEKLYVPYRTR